MKKNQTVSPGVAMETGSTCLIRSGDEHQNRNIGSGAAVLMITFSNGARNYEVL